MRFPTVVTIADDPRTRPAPETPHRTDLLFVATSSHYRRPGAPFASWSALRTAAMANPGGTRAIAFEAEHRSEIERPSPTFLTPALITRTARRVANRWQSNSSCPVDISGSRYSTSHNHAGRRARTLGSRVRHRFSSRSARAGPSRDGERTKSRSRLSRLMRGVDFMSSSKAA